MNLEYTNYGIFPFVLFIIFVKIDMADEIRGYFNWVCYLTGLKTENFGNCKICKQKIKLKKTLCIKCKSDLIQIRVCIKCMITDINGECNCQKKIIWLYPYKMIQSFCGATGQHNPLWRDRPRFKSVLRHFFLLICNSWRTRHPNRQLRQAIPIGTGSTKWPSQVQNSSSRHKIIFLNLK